MTDRIHGCVVYFDRDIREDDVIPVLDAIRMIKGVAVVSTNDTRERSYEIQTAKVRLRLDLYEKIRDLFLKETEV